MAKSFFSFCNFGSLITCWAIIDDAFCSFTLLSVLEKVFTVFF